MLKKIIIISGAIIIAAAGTIAGLELSNTTHWFHKPVDQVITTVGSTGPQPQPNHSASSRVSAGQTHQSTGSNGTNTGSINSTNGQASTTTSPSQWVTSKSGVITVKQPTANATLTSGSQLVGTAQANQIHFRLIDNQTGVIAQGVLNVVNGKFSGNLNFTNQSSTGQLDVFTTTPQLVEENEIQIGVNFGE